MEISSLSSSFHILKNQTQNSNHMKNHISGTICIFSLDKAVYFLWITTRDVTDLIIRLQHFYFLNDNTAVVSCICTFNISCALGTNVNRYI